MHIYAFGSICRGDVTRGSDVDLLAISDVDDLKLDSAVYSVYSYARVQELWTEGNPFAWHLFLESRLLFSDDRSDFLRDLARPHSYDVARRDCEKFSLLFEVAKRSLLVGSPSPTFELSTIFLAVRNFATCFALGVLAKPDFSRRVALCLGRHSLDINLGAFDVMERARIISTRGIGERIGRHELALAVDSFDSIGAWMAELSLLVESHARVQ